MAPWLRLPTVSGVVGGETDAHAITTGNLEVPLLLILSAHQVREGSYSETLAIRVRTDAASERSLPMRVSLTIRAGANHAVWNPDDHPQQCTATRAELQLARRVTVGQTFQVRFTVCDSDSLPLDHQVEIREFGVALSVVSTLNPGRRRLQSGGDNVGVATQEDVTRIEYLGSGNYQVYVTVSLPGSFRIALSHAGSVTTLLGNATCATGRVVIEYGGCGCEDGKFENPTTRECEECAAGTSSFRGALGAEGCSFWCGRSSGTRASETLPHTAPNAGSLRADTCRFPPLTARTTSLDPRHHTMS